MRKPPHTVRNHVARSPLLGKGGVHSESKSSARMQSRQSTRHLIDDWLDTEEEQHIDNTNAPISGR